MQRERERESGFTLIELMVVILIIAILMAIAIPTYLGARNRAENRAARANLRTALSAVTVAYSTQGSFTLPSGYTSWQSYFQSIEPSLIWTPNASPSVGTIEFGFENNQSIYLSNLSASGTCWTIAVAETTSGVFTGVPHPGTYYGRFLPASSAGCNNGDSPGWGGWQTSFSAAG
ncbi:MAG: type II secretion system protein [Acidimicrobiales bacterium]